MERDLVIFDVETTGLDPQKDYIIELSAVKYDSSFKIIGKYLQRFYSPVEIPAEVSAVHGITNADLLSSPSFNQEEQKIYEFLYGCNIGGYNVLFDLKFLLEKAADAHLTKEVRYLLDRQFHIVDVMKIFAKYEPRTLSAVYKRMFGHEFENAHSAEADVLATGDILQELINRGFCKLDYTELQELSDTHNLADLNRKFAWQDDLLVWNFGKHIGKPVTYDRGYLEWFRRSDFPYESQSFLSRYLEVC